MVFGPRKTGQKKLKNSSKHQKMAPNRPKNVKNRSKTRKKPKNHQKVTLEAAKDSETGPAPKCCFWPNFRFFGVSEGIIR